MATGALAIAAAWAWPQDLMKSGGELPALMTAGRWKSSMRPARYTERQAPGRGRVLSTFSKKVLANWPA